MARSNPQPPVIPNGYCAGCQKYRDLYRVEDSRYRCADCYPAEKGTRPQVEPKKEER